MSFDLNEKKNINGQISKVVSEFTKQAKNFNDYQKAFSKEEYNDFAINNMHLAGDESVLEVAAGTCAFGRSVASHVSHITELDVTEAMLNVGRAEAAAQNIRNVSFIKGEAEHLPFDNSSFDMVMSRLAFHHFLDIETSFSEMVRVLKPGGKLVVIDMKARDEALRETADKLERLRDPSHTRCVSEEEFRLLSEKYHLNVEFCETIRVPVSLKSWMDLTGVKEPAKTDIISAMKADIENNKKTGFEPYKKEDELYFDHRWMLMVCNKAV